MTDSCRYRLACTGVFALAFFLSASVSADERIDRLAQKYRDWIEKEVVYIISDREKEAFLDLEFEEEREGFIPAFWRRRDPDSLTPVNEFKEEHYRRIELANRQLGREAAVPGWMTDRGKMYIILGEPRDRETFMSVPFLYPSELWFYGADKQKGLPPLYLLFFQEYHAGPYRPLQRKQMADAPVGRWASHHVEIVILTEDADAIGIFVHRIFLRSSTTKRYTM